MHLYYDPDGNAIDDVLVWAEMFEKRRADMPHPRTLIAGGVPWHTYLVSTVWLGLDHNFSHVGPPLIFETMVFADGSTFDLLCWRYPTWDEAFAGHEAAKWLIRASCEGHAWNRMQMRAAR